tara:strand:- start:799 stop:1308 length:510 start_codon:yes stop_codon:yes gene_type:complete
MFTVEFHKSFCREWGWSKQKILSMVPFEDKTLKDHHISFTDYFKQDIPEYSSLFMSIVRDALEEFAYKSEYKFNDVTALWCQRYNNGDYFQPHDHGGIGYSCVFYAEYDQKEHGSTTFFAPFQSADGHRKSYSPTVGEGELLIFPANVMHMAPPNYSSKHRTIFSFNLI